jgi:hypothetical protein
MIWEIDMIRESCGFKTLEIEADTKEDAREKAYDIAGDFEYSEKEAEYRIKHIQLKEKQ